MKALNLSISEQISELVKHINLATPVSSIILFGSQVNGFPTKDSDIDLCVITQEQDKRKLQILREIRKAIASISSFPIDILVYQEKEFAERANLPTTLEFKIKQEGLKVYGQ